MKRTLVSIKSAKRLVSTFLTIGPSEIMLHQTLTHSPPVYDAAKSKRLLYLLLDNLHTKYKNVASLYVLEKQESGNVHYHVLFFFFQKEHLPFYRSEMRKKFGSVCFEAWNALNEGKLDRRANLTKERERWIGYLTKEIRVLPPDKKNDRNNFLWWGVRNKKLFSQFSIPLDQKTAKQTFKQEFRLWIPPATKRYSSYDLRKEKYDIEQWSDWAGTTDWESFKQQETGHKGHVSDAKFIEFKNGSKPWGPRKVHKNVPF